MVSELAAGLSAVAAVGVSDVCAFSCCCRDRFRRFVLGTALWAAKGKVALLWAWAGFSLYDTGAGGVGGFAAGPEECPIATACVCVAVVSELAAGLSAFASRFFAARI